MSLYEYRAVVRSIYDADTIRLDIDLGFGAWLHNQSVRLYGIDAWEIRGEEREKGLAAKEFVEGIVPPETEVLIRTFKDTKGKYGRWLASIFTIPFGDDIADLLVARGHAEYRDY